MVIGTAAAVWLSAPQARAATHLVRPGETLSGIARGYGTTVGALARLNDLRDPDLIVAGQRLRVRRARRPLSTHVVTSGETLSGIAARFGTTVAALVRANRLGDANLIVAGSRLKIPSVRRPSAPSRSGSIRSALQHHATAHGVDPALVKAVAWQESGWRQSARSSVGAIGVMQVMPDTARYINRVLHPGKLNVRSADGNIHLGVTYLRHMLRIMGSERRALAAYYSGPGNVGRKLKGYQRVYVNAVQALKARF